MSKISLVASDDPVLYRKAKKITKNDLKSDEIQKLIDRLVEIMRKEGAVGIAAPQVGVNLSIAVYEYKYRKSLPQHQEIPLKVIVNPKINFYTDVIESAYEGCLSVKGIKGVVQRYKEVECSYMDRDGNEFVKMFSGLEARIVQHECDHLDGVLFFKRISDFSSLKSI